MSGIAGIFYIDGKPVGQTELNRMVESIAHRGPDGSGTWQDGSVGLGHCALWTTPESLHEHLPLADQTGNFAITADARIDNREELIAILGLEVHPAGQIPDSLLILKAYEKWGESCPARLLGDFAFAIWDARERTLFCARDHIGAKPFYYYHSEKIFIFASEIKALLTNEMVPRRLNELRVADHLAFIIEDKAITYYQDVFRLPPARSISVRRSQMEMRTYWSLDPSREIRLKDDREYADAFREVFSQAVHCRLRSAFPVGSALSGGLDSSSIACVARDLLVQNGNQPLHTFSAIFPGLPANDLRIIDERPYMQAVLKTGGFEPHFVQADRLSPLTDLDSLLWHLDEAIFAPNLYLRRALFQSARQQDVRVFLHGTDGDSTVSHGLERMADLARTFRWKALLTEANHLSRQPGVVAGPFKIAWRLGFKPLVPLPFLNIWQTVKGNKRQHWAEFSVINKDFAKRVGLKKQITTLNRNGHHPLRSARQAHYRSLNSGLLPRLMEIDDKTSAPFMLECRYPYFDRRLMEFCLALPAEQKFAHGWTRSILRGAMDGILPSEVQWRFTKGDISPNFKRQLLKRECETLEKVIQVAPGVIQEYVDLPALQAVYHRYRSKNKSIETDAMVVYSVVVLAKWLQNIDFVD